MTQSPNSRAVRRLCVSGVLGALALALSYLESLIPLPIPLPGVKLGLGNLCVLLALYLYSWRWAGLVLAVKALLSSLLFAGLGALPYALCGGCLALLVMACLKPCRALSPVGVSIAGAAAHGLGQVLLGAWRTATPQLLMYATPLMLVGLCTGGALSWFVLWCEPRLRRFA